MLLEWGSPFWTLRRPSRAGRVKTTETMQVRDVGERIQRSYQSKVRLGYGPITNVSLQTPGGALEGLAASISLACPGKWLLLVHAILGGLREHQNCRFSRNTALKPLVTGRLSGWTLPDGTLLPLHGTKRNWSTPVGSIPHGSVGVTAHSCKGHGYVPLLCTAIGGGGVRPQKSGP